MAKFDPDGAENRSVELQFGGYFRKVYSHYFGSIQNRARFVVIRARSMMSGSVNSRIKY